MFKAILQPLDLKKKHLKTNNMNSKLLFFSFLAFWRYDSTTVILYILSVCIGFKTKMVIRETAYTKCLTNSDLSVNSSVLLPFCSFTNSRLTVYTSDSGCPSSYWPILEDQQKWGKDIDSHIEDKYLVKSDFRDRKKEWRHAEDIRVTDENLRRVTLTVDDEDAAVAVSVCVCSLGSGWFGVWRLWHGECLWICSRNF